jgi:hypothetical protein
MSKKFVMIRVNDIGGVSGTGHVLDGIKFSNGKVAVAWLGKGPVQAASGLGQLRRFYKYSR